jgi:hypothetical protein
MGIGKGKSNIKAVGSAMRTGLVLLFFLAMANLSSACSDGSTTDAGTNTSAAGANRIMPNAVTSAQTGSLEPPRNNQTAGGVPAGNNPILRFEPAPEDSQIAVATKSNGQLYETRIFKRHPQLVKVDSTSFGGKEKELNILLRDGQVKSVTTDSLGDLKQATSSQLLQLAGIRPGGPPMRGKAGVKEIQ